MSASDLLARATALATLLKEQNRKAQSNLTKLNKPTTTPNFSKGGAVASRFTQYNQGRGTGRGRGQSQQHIPNPRYYQSGRGSFRGRGFRPSTYGYARGSRTSWRGRYADKSFAGKYSVPRYSSARQTYRVWYPAATPSYNSYYHQQYNYSPRGGYTSWRPQGYFVGSRGRGGRGWASRVRQSWHSTRGRGRSHGSWNEIGSTRVHMATIARSNNIKNNIKNNVKNNIINNISNKTFKKPINTQTLSQQAASLLLQRSVLVARLKLQAQKKSGSTTQKKMCSSFIRFGKCIKRGKGCNLVHDASKIRVCTRFLRGTCTNEHCPFSHKVTREKMPVCYHFLRGLCSKDPCMYRHVKVDDDAIVCEAFLTGYCAAGDSCKYKHTARPKKAKASSSTISNPTSTLKHDSRNTNSKSNFNTPVVTPHSTNQNYHQTQNQTQNENQKSSMNSTETLTGNNTHHKDYRVVNRRTSTGVCAPASFMRLSKQS